MCQLHISLTRAAQIYLELHFCVELHTKKSPARKARRYSARCNSTAAAAGDAAAITQFTD